MSYANWNATAFYLADDIVVYNGEDYQALVNNRNIVPLGSPATWNAISPPGPGPSNQLAFTQATTDLSIVGGNTIDISPQLVYSGSSDPATNALSVGNTNVIVSTIPQLTFSETTTGTIARPIIQTLVDDPAPPPVNPPPYRLIEAQYIKNVSELWKFFIDVQAGNHTIGSEFTGVGGAGLNIAAQPLVLIGSNGQGQQITIKDGVNNVSGDLWIRPDGVLMWNTNPIYTPESGIASILSASTSISVSTTGTLSATAIISLTFTFDGTSPNVPPNGQSLWYELTGPNSFTINIDAPTSTPGGILKVAWSILRP